MIAFWRTPAYVLVGATVIAMISMGVRQTFGLFMEPLSTDLGWGRDVFSFALALQNLVIGLAAPFVAAVGDKWGPIRAIAAAAAVYSAGVWLMSQSATPVTMIASTGVITGLGVSGCGLALMMALAGRVAPDNRRTLWLGIVTAGGTGGQLVVLPAGAVLLDAHGWVITATVMAVATAFIVPLALSLSAGSAEALSRPTNQNLGEALGEAKRHRGYWLLVTGFFVCGFQVQFIIAHLPAYLTDSGAAKTLAASALATIGLFNLIGSWLAGWLGDRYRKRALLAFIYGARALAILIFIQFPVSEASVLAFSAVLGLLWLSTAPLTSGIVAQVFGPRYMGTLFAIAYLSHQAGAFAGVWLGGVIYDATGSYDAFWWLAIVAGLAAALIHLPIDDRPLLRTSEAA
jgi:predicted MFS family arabinose efflux permease